MPYDKESEREAEKAVLALLLDNPSLVSTSGCVEEYFENHDYAVTFKYLKSLYESGAVCDTISLIAAMEKDGITRPSYAELGKVLLSSGSQTSLSFYINLLRERYERGKVLTVISNIQKAYKNGLDTPEIIEQAVTSLESIYVAKENTVTLADELKLEVQKIHDDVSSINAGNELLLGLPFGMGLERFIAGGAPFSTVCVLCGDSGIGKSTVLQNILDSVSAGGYESIVFTLEDSKELYRQRALSRFSGVPLENVLKRELTAEDLKKLRRIENATITNASRVHIFDAAGLSADDIISEYRRVRQNNKRIKLIAIDYLQILGGREDDERIRIRNAMLKLQHAAKRDGICILVVSQLNREGIKGRSDPRPRKEDLYGSGSIEQYSKLILGVHRPARYGDPIKGRHYKDESDFPSKEVWQARLELWVLKNIRGEDNIFTDLQWNRQTGAIVSEHWN
jgi:replicative DNA helicase